MIGRLLPRYILTRAPYNVPWAKLRFNKTSQGRPYPSTPDLTFAFDFNISHDSDWVVCISQCGALDDELPTLGVDVMRLAIPWEDSTNADLFETMRDLMSADEVAAYLSLRQQDQLTYLLRLWTIKEAIAKAQGLGLGADLSSFNISLDGPAQHRSTSSAKRYNLKELQLEDHLVAVASTARLGDVKVINLATDDLIMHARRYL